jgi:hypothetical protein
VFYEGRGVRGYAKVIYEMDKKDWVGVYVFDVSAYWKLITFLPD